MKYGVFCCGYNCKAYVHNAVTSLKAQTMQDFVAVLVDDCSTDTTHMQLSGEADGRMTIIRNDSRRGGTLARLRACQELDGLGVDVMVQLDMDDQLLPGALARIAQEYEAGAWMTYGNWIDEKGCTWPHRTMTREAYGGMWASTANWFMTHCLTFRSDLWRKIPNSNWFRADHSPFGGSQIDALLVFPMAAMAGADRIHGIPDTIYRYTRFGGDSCIRTVPQATRDSEWAEIVSRPRLSRVEAL